MAAPIFQRTVVDTQGNIVEGAVVEVRNEATDELAPIFVDRPLTDVKANPFTTDSTGFIRFFAAAGDYRIKATFGAEEIIFRFVQLIDTDELIDFDSAQTLTNKTLTSPALTNPSYTGTLTGGTGVVNLGSGQLFKDANGNVGYGTSSPVSKIHLSGASTADARITLTQTTAGLTSTLQQGATGLALGAAGSQALIFDTNGLQRMSIDSSGNLLVGTSTANVFLNNTANAGGISMMRLIEGMRLDVARDGSCYTANRPSTDGIIFDFRRSGNNVGNISVTATTTAYNTSSDYRLKHDIAPMTGALSRVALLKPCTYKWNLDDSADQGFIAHELQEVCPAAVTGEKDAVETYTDADGVEQTRPVYQGIDTSFLVATLTAALQELNAKFDAYVASHP